MKNFILFVFLFVSFFKTEAKIWEVGENLSYKSPSSVTSLAQINDTVYIHKGVYLQDVCKWTANNLLLKGVDERPILNSNGISSGGKAIWVISGNNVRVENIEFSNCRVPDKNGAGIRVEGVNISII
ncbi:MAG: right-handed parallel beta-helix repeat-containing protein, partial [Candidatus Kapaibacterium sp.]